MSWKLKITDQWAEKLRFTVRGVLFLNTIILSLASIYVVAKLVWFFIRFLDRTIFSTPW